MKKIAKKISFFISVPIGVLLALLSSCRHRNIEQNVSVVYGPPPVEKKDKQPRPRPVNGQPVLKQMYQRPRPVVYGPPPTRTNKTDTIKSKKPKGEK